MMRDAEKGVLEKPPRGTCSQLQTRNARQAKCTGKTNLRRMKLTGVRCHSFCGTAARSRLIRVDKREDGNKAPKKQNVGLREV